MPETRRRHDRRHQHDDPFAVVIVRDVPGRQREQKHRDHQRQPHEAQRQGGIGAAGSLINFPAEGHGEHLLAEHRHQPADEIKCEIPVPENGIRMLARLGEAVRRSRVIGFTGGGGGFSGDSASCMGAMKVNVAQISLPVESFGTSRTTHGSVDEMMLPRERGTQTTCLVCISHHPPLQ